MKAMGERAAKFQMGPSCHKPRLASLPRDASPSLSVLRAEMRQIWMLLQMVQAWQSPTKPHPSPGTCVGATGAYTHH